MTTATTIATATIDGARTAVTVNLIADATCGHGHRHTIGASHLDAGQLGERALQWAREHANTCDGGVG